MDKELITNYSDKITKWTLVALVFLLPLILNPWGFDKYSLTKLIFLRLVTLVLVIAWTVKAGQDGKLRLTSTLLNLPLLCLSLAVIGSTFFSIHPVTSIYGSSTRYEGLITILNYFLLFYFTLLHFSSKQAKDYQFLIRILFSSAFIASIYGIAQHFGLDFFRQTPESIDPARSFSTLVNPIFLGAFLSLVIPLLLVELAKTDSSAESIILSGVLIVVGSCLVFTYSRAAWLGTAISILIVILFSFRQIWQKKQVLLQLGLITLAITVASALPAQSSQLKTYSVLDRASSTFEIKEETASSRLAIWQTTPAIIKDHPLAGSGPDTFRLIFPKYKSVKIAPKLTEPGMIDKAHNNLLQSATTHGLLGLLFYLWFLLAFFIRGFADLKKNPRSPFGPLQIGLLAALLGYIVQIQFSFSIILVAPIFWLMVGLVASTWENRTYALEFPGKQFQVAATYSTYLLLAGLTVFTMVSDSKTMAADVHAYKGWEDFMNGVYGQAASQFKQAANLNSDQIKYSLFLGSAYFKIAAAPQTSPELQVHWLGQAENVLKTASRQSPLDGAPYRTLGSMYFFLQNSNEQYLNKASLYFKKALELDPNNHLIHFNLGTVYANQNRLESAIYEWEKAVQLNPKLGDAYYNLGQAFEDKGDLKKAESNYEKVVQLRPADWEAKESLKRVRKDLEGK